MTYTGTDSKPLDSYLDLFTQTDAASHFFVSAEANGGKTTMLRKICRDWADQCQLTDGSRKEENGLSKFTLVIPIILRSIQQGASLFETIQEQLGLSEKDMKTLSYCLKTSDFSCLFIADGLDEYDLGKSQEVTGIMNGCLYQSSWCIITSRQEGRAHLKNWCQVLYQQAELKGFSEESIRKYVRQFFLKTASDLGEKLIQTIFPEVLPDREYFSSVIQDASEGLIELASNPGRLAIICIIFCDKKALPSTKEQLTQEFIEFMLRRWEHKCDIEVRKCHQEQSNIFDRHRESLLKLSSLACETEGVKMKLVFKHAEVTNVIDTNLMKLGLLYKSHPVSRLHHCQYSFLHKSIQEYLAAYRLYYYGGGGTVAAETVFKKLVEQYTDTENADADVFKYLICLVQVWVMCEFVSLQELSLIISKALCQLDQWRAAHNVLILLLRALRRAPLEQMALPEPVVVERVTKKIMFQLPLYAVYHVDENNRQVTPPAASLLCQDDRLLCELTWPVHLQALRVLDAAIKQSDKFKLDAYQRCNPMAALYYYHRLPLVLKGPIVEHLQLMTAGKTNFVGFNKFIKSIEIINSHLSGKGFWSASSLASLDCQEIRIQTCHLHQMDVKEMNVCLQKQHSSLTTEVLSLNKNNLCSAGKDIVQLLMYMPGLTSFDLENNNLSKEDKEVILNFSSRKKKHLQVCFDDEDSVRSEQGKKAISSQEYAEDSFNVDESFVDMRKLRQKSTGSIPGSSPVDALENTVTKVNGRRRNKKCALL